MQETIIQVKNINPTFTDNLSGADAFRDTIIELWLEAQSYLQNQIIEYHKLPNIEFTLDCSELIKVLDALKDGKCEQYFEDLVASHSPKSMEEFYNLNPHGAKVVFKFDTEQDLTKHQLRSLSIRLLQQLFLAMNICMQGGCNLFNISFPHLDNFLCKSECLSGYILEEAWGKSRLWKWPNLERLKFSQTWKWLEMIHFRNIAFAHTTPQKACFVLLRLSRENLLDESEILYLSQILEGFFVKKGDPVIKTVNKRLYAVLGSPKTKQDWFKHFYRLRSEIAHGSHHIFRPNFSDDFDEEITEYVENIEDSIKQTVAVILGILQDLVRNNATQYQFAETVTASRLWQA